MTSHQDCSYIDQNHNKVYSLVLSMDQNNRIIGIKSGNFFGVIKRFKPPSLHKIKRKEHLISFLEKRKERK